MLHQYHQIISYVAADLNLLLSCAFVFEIFSDKHFLYSTKWMNSIVTRDVIGAFLILNVHL